MRKVLKFFHKKNSAKERENSKFNLIKKYLKMYKIFI